MIVRAASRRRGVACAFAAAVVVVAACGGASAREDASDSAAQPAGAPMGGDSAIPAGTWDVVRVAVDPGDQPHWRYRPDDPRLLGRELRVGAADATLNDGTDPCVNARWRAERRTWEALLTAGFARPAAANRAVAPTPDEMGLAVRPGAETTVWTPACGGDWNEAWLAQVAADTVAMRLDASALLVLARRPAGARPAPSFACAGARDEALVAICGDVALAAWDRSVNAALRAARTRAPAEAAQLDAEQRAWDATRSRCRGDAACLGDAMQRRVEELSLL